MKFVFKGKDKDGQIREGVVEAMSEEAGARILEKNGLVPISIIRRKEPLALLKGFSSIWEGVNQREQLVFFQQLSTLIEGRMPIVSSLRTIAEQTENQYLRIILREMGDDVDDGMSLSDAMEKHPKVFSSLTINMLRAGEVSGTLQKSISVISNNIEKNYQLASKIKGALYYPMFVLLVAFIIGFLVITFVLPKITLMIKDLHVPIPWYTAALIAIGDFMSAYWWAVLLVLVGTIIGLIYYAQTESGKKEWELILLKIPVIGKLAKNIYITRFAENLSALLDGGIPVVRALLIVSDVIGNQVFEKIVRRAAEEVKTGGTMSTVFMRTNEFPPMVSQMIRIGEETGTLSDVLGSTGKFYNQEVDTMTRNLTSLIEPILIVFLGIGVGILVVGVLMPIYNIAGKL